MKPLWTANLGALHEENNELFTTKQRILHTTSPLFHKPVFTNYTNIMFDTAHCFRQIPYRFEVGCLQLTGDFWCSSTQNDPGSIPTIVTDLKTKTEQANQSPEYH
jgi:hypothetical protein